MTTTKPRPKFIIRSFLATIGPVSQETIIALCGDELLGQVLLKCDGRRVAQFAWLVVGDRNEGIGSALLKQAEKIAREHDCESIACEIDSFNHDVVKWYQKRGYILTAELDDGTLFMAKKLRGK